MKIAVPRERVPGERRVALVPETAGKLVKAGIAVAIERDAGRAAGFLDEAYTAAGATIVSDDASLLADADIVVRVNKPSDAELNGLKRGAIVIGFLAPLASGSMLNLSAASVCAALIGFGLWWAAQHRVSRFQCIKD